MPVVFSDLEKEATIQLNITIDEVQFEYESSVYKHHKKYVLIEPVRKEGKIFAVHKDNTTVDIIYNRENEKPLIWKNAELKCVRYKDQIFYAVPADLPGKEHNRRGAFRLFIGEERRAKIGKNRRSYHVILKDLSNSGFAFISAQKIKDPEGTFVYLVYPVTLSGNTFELMLFGKIVREIELENEETLYGCILLKKSGLIGHYINQKQREQLAKKQGRLSDAE